MMSGEMKKPGETRTPCVCVTVWTQEDEKKKWNNKKKKNLKPHLAQVLNEMGEDSGFAAAAPSCVQPFALSCSISAHV